MLVQAAAAAPAINLRCARNSPLKEEGEEEQNIVGASGFSLDSFGSVSFLYIDSVPKLGA